MPLSPKIFSQNCPVYYDDKSFWSWIFPSDVVPFQSKEVWHFFGPWTQYRRMGPAYFVTSSRGSFAHETSIKTEIAKSIHFFLLLTHCGRWRVFCAKRWHFLSKFCCYIQKQYTNQVFCKKRELSLPVWACFVRKRNTEMTSQSELDPFSCIVVHGPEKVQYTKEKSRVKNVLAIVIRAVAKVFLWKKFWGLVAL